MLQPPRKIHQQVTIWIKGETLTDVEIIGHTKTQFVILLFRRVNAMAYSNFTLETVRKTFQLEADEAADISSGIEPVALSEHLTTTLSRNVPLVVAIGTEKAKSENDRHQCSC